MKIVLLTEGVRWTKQRGIAAKLRHAVKQTLAEHESGGALTLLLAGDAKLRTLNHAFRGKDAPTNVLSFPAAENNDNYLGDIAIAYNVTAKEARAAGKTFADHATHLAVHGTLHLLGFDHARPGEAKRMETEERRILGLFGISDPYALKSERS
jgi:probable rRNA maturation factor